jgi:hypothetical protein
LKYSYYIGEVTVKEIIRALELPTDSVKFDGRTGWIEIKPEHRMFLLRISADGYSLLGTNILLKKDRTISISIEAEDDGVLKKIQGFYGGYFIPASKFKTLNDERGYY